MAKNRIINTKFWVDTYVLNELNPVDKLMFLYLITNPYTDISGIYELPLKIMAVETGIDKENIENVILPRFEKDGKILYEDGWIAIKNFQKHQTTNPKVKMGMKIGMSKAPLKLREFIENDSLSIDYDSLSHSNLNSNSNSNPNTAEINSANLIPSIIDAFKEVNPAYKKWFGNKTQRGAVARLIDEHGLDKVLEVVAILPQTNEMKFIPTITTPLQLEDKWSSLEANLKKQKKSAREYIL